MEQLIQTNISMNLPDNRFVLLRKGEKKPIADEWTTRPGLSRNMAQKYLSLGYNVGLMLGQGFVGIDCDSKELEEVIERTVKKETYTQLSANRGLKHYIFKVKDFDINLNLDNGEPTHFIKNKEKVKNPNYKRFGEVLCTGKQLVVYPSKLENNKQYQIFRDLPIAEISKDELLGLVMQFHSKLTKIANQEKKELSSYTKSDIDELKITDVLSTAGMNKDSRGQYYGSNPWHGSDTGSNFYISPNKNLAYCFRSGCDCAISPIKALALNEGIISNCTDELRGELFLKAKDIAVERYGLVRENKTELSEQKEVELEILSAKDLLHYRKPKNWIIKDYAFPSEIVMSAGKEASFKSMVMIYKAVCISKGLDYFGIPTRKCSVLIISAENSPFVDGERLRAIMKGLNIRTLNNFFILTRANDVNLLSPLFKEQLKKVILNKNIKALFVDTINPVTPEIDDNKAKDVTTVFNKFLKPFADEHELYIEFAHHTDKIGRDVLGSTKWKGNSDTVYFFDRKKLEPSVIISNTKNRYGENLTLKVGFEILNNDGKLEKIIFHLMKKEGIGRQMEKKLSKKDIAKTTIKKLLSNKSLSFSDLKKEVMKKNISESTFKLALNELDAIEEIESKDDVYILRRKVQ